MQVLHQAVHCIIQCNGTVALENFFDVATDKSVAAVVGCGCSSATEDVAKISHYLNTSVVRLAKCFLKLMLADLVCKYVSGAQRHVSVSKPV